MDEGGEMMDTTPLSKRFVLALVLLAVLGFSIMSALTLLSGELLDLICEVGRRGDAAAAARCVAE